jgi:hypothetical protein
MVTCRHLSVSEALSYLAHSSGQSCWGWRNVTLEDLKSLRYEVFRIIQCMKWSEHAIRIWIDDNFCYALQTLRDLQTNSSSDMFQGDFNDEEFAARLQAAYDQEDLEPALPQRVNRMSAYHQGYVVGHSPKTLQGSSVYSQGEGYTQKPRPAMKSIHQISGEDRGSGIHAKVEESNERRDSPAVSEARVGVQVDVDPALQQFGERILRANCAHCNKHLIYNDKDIVKLTKRWVNSQAAVDSVLVCGKCSKSTCVGCGTLRNSYHAPSRRSPKSMKTPEPQEGLPVWCCDTGRLFLIWALLCTSEHQKACNDRRDSYFTRSRAASDPPKASRPVRNSNGVGYGDNLGGGGYFPGAFTFQSPLDAFGDMPIPALVKRKPFPPPMPKKVKDNTDLVLEPTFRNLAALLPKLEGSMPFDQDPPAVLISMIQRSPILEKTAELLRNESLDDLTKRRGLYQRMFDFMQALASHPTTAVAVFQSRIVYPPDSGLLLVSFGERKNDYHGKGKFKTETAQPLAAVISNLQIASRKMLKQSKSRLDEFQSTEGSNLLALCIRICEVSDFLQVNCLPQKEVEISKGKGKAPMKQEDSMEQWHREHCVDEVPDETLQQNFYFSRLASDIDGMPTKKGRMKHLMTELSTLQTALPEGIYVRHGSSRLDCMKVMISGPKDTPYEGGLFEFDLFCPLNYPNETPKMQFKTTGGGMAHFNPNLYADGKGKSDLQKFSGAVVSQTSQSLSMCSKFWARSSIGFARICKDFQSVECG